MSEVLEDLNWRLIGLSRAIPGFAYGSRYPIIFGVMTGRDLTPQKFATVVDRLREALLFFDGSAENLAVAEPAGDALRSGVEWILAVMHEIQRAAELPVFEPGRVVSIDQQRAEFILPTVQGAHLPLFAALRALLELINAELDGKTSGAALAKISESLTELKRLSPVGSNVPRFVRAAFGMALPFQELPGQIYQYGQGERSRWMKSSFTGDTPRISAELARNKVLAAAMLRQAGIPVPDHQLAPNLETALQAAERLGYPVVVKPADLDGGVGVAPGLRSADEVRVAWQAIQGRSENILVEKHVEGNDYRVTVFQGEVIWATERVPGGVTGDGQRMISALVEQANADPRRAARKHAPLRQLVLDDEAMALLRQANLAPSSVPPAGQFIRLRRAANIWSGGMPVPAIERIHPDNRRLAIRAVQALRLDLAGVDLLMPDISRSWRETGAAICEVNGQPALGIITGATVYDVILRRLVPADGRIPTVLILGGAGELSGDLENILLRNKIAVGCHDASGVRVKGERFKDGTVDVFTAGCMLALDLNVGAIILGINDDAVLRTGLPFARFDVLVIAGENAEPLLPALLRSILPACDGVIIAIEQPELAGEFAHLTSGGWRDIKNDGHEVRTAILAGIDMAFERHHAGGASFGEH